MADIVLDKVSKKFPDGTIAASDVDLEVGDGEFVILVGPSGCGKSTTLNMIAGLEDISSGDLYIGGERMNDKAPKDRDIAMVFQSYALYPNMTVRENMSFPLRLAKLDKATVAQKVDEAARVLELEQLLDRKPANLSGGQRQRVAMGRAIVRSPKAYLMDEPLSNLDAKLRVQMRTQVSRLQKQLGTTTVYVTHDQTEAMTLGDRVVVMRQGRVQQVGPPQELYDSPANLFVAGFIGSPAMNFVHARLTDGQLSSVLGDVSLSGSLRRALAASDAPADLILGIRPEHFEDAGLVDEAHLGTGARFEGQADVVESMGSDKYVYLPLAAERASTAELDELAADAGATDLPASGAQLVTRLSAESPATEGAQVRVWFNPEKIHLFDPETGRNLTLAR
ncbi:MAG: sn-glycerol-3-phosphate ABC transporter ATP-binding protein UgpC [Micromonosporaceae bacterium]|nr:sn-glycerol-3-phosphate ABC transporter ATP-binding protein UgpC [Micromonosporaceae bacterium]